ncbi:hypothetical protein BGZ72_002026 [Mortierella alpina]|nr:hypothetical protein BGZ72_002026 [Mortierella alpina]
MTPPFPELSQQESALYWHQQDEPAVHHDDRTLHHLSQSLTSSFSDPEQQHTQRPVYDIGAVQLQRRKDPSTHRTQLPLASGYSLSSRPEDISTVTDNTPGGSWVSDLNAEEKGIARRQHNVHLRHSSPAMGTPLRTLRQPETQESEDREVYRVCRGRMKEFPPSRDNQTESMGAIRSSYLPSRGYNEGARIGSSRPHHTALGEHNREQGCSQQQDHEAYTLTDMQENIERGQFLHSQFDVVDCEEEHRDSLGRVREQELLTIIAQLEQQVIDLTTANEELRSSLHVSEERFDCLIMEQEVKLIQLKEEHEHSVLDTKHRTKRLFDQVMRKQRLDEGKRLATVFKELQSVQLENTDLHARLQSMQEATLEVERDSKKDARVLHAFWDQELLPSLRIGMPLCGQDIRTVLDEPPSPKQRKDSLWDTVHGQGQKHGQLGASKAAMNCSMISAVAVSTIASNDNDADIEAIAKDGRRAMPGLSSRACKTSLGQQCLALLQYLLTTLLEPQDVHDHECSGQNVHCKFTGQEHYRFMDRRQQRKRYSDSSASSGKTLVAPPQHQQAWRADCQGGCWSSCATVLRRDPAKYFGDLRVEHQREIDRIKEQCVSVYRESLEDVRTEMLAKMRSKIRAGYEKR